MVDTQTTMIISAMEAAIRAKVPIMLVGAPGTGKTATIKELAKKLNYDLITLIGSQMDPTDVTGLPKGEKVLQKEDGEFIWGTSYLAPYWQVKIMQKKKVILFFDEFSNTPGATRASLLTLLQNREFANGEVMPDETIIIGAMNPTEQAADGYELDLPTTNRLFFIPWSPSNDSWFEGMLNAWGSEVSNNELMWRRKIVNFLKSQTRFIHAEPNSNTTGTTEAFNIPNNDLSRMEVLRSAWPSQRSWDKLAQVLGNTVNDNSIQDMIAEGIVGYSAAMAFRSWLRSNDVIDPREVIEDPSIVDWKEASVDNSNLILRSIIDLLDKNNAMKVINVFNTIANEGRTDLGAPYIKELLQKVMNIIPQNDKSQYLPVLKDLTKKYSNYNNKK